MDKNIARPVREFLIFGERRRDENIGVGNRSEVSIRFACSDMLSFNIAKEAKRENILIDEIIRKFLYYYWFGARNEIELVVMENEMRMEMLGGLKGIY